MIKKLLCSFILFISLFQLSGRCIPAAADEMPKDDKLLVSASMEGGITVIRAITTLRPGDAGLITIQGRPGVKYTLSSTFRIGNRTTAVSQWRVGDSRGHATFNWFVGLDSVPGTYPITIRGDGEVLRLSHTVLP
ncbi:MAG: hypothetical protein Q8930_20810 [Bacillota bacterium]|nr:hypothetical protein [Bacillota bacterium]